MKAFIGPIALVLKGACIGVANVIPGVSGGTMALVLGLYERLIDALHKVGWQTVKAVFPPYPDGLPAKWKAEWERIDFFFLVFLGVGAAGAVLVCAKLIPYLMSTHHDPTYGFFWGLILASIIVPWQMLRKISWKEVLACILAVGMTAALSYEIGTRNIDKAKRKEALKRTEQVSAAATEVPAKRPDASSGRLVFLFVCGALAMSAMILPGVSGSFVLLLLGAYFDVLLAINNLRRLDFHPSNILVFVVVGCGAVAGLLGFTRLLNFVFKRYHDTTVAALIGLMLGSLYGIWPFRHYEVVAGERVDGMPVVPTMDRNFVMTAAAVIAGIAIIGVFVWVEKRTGTGEAVVEA